ncbi:hypothetical protein [Ramlibacter tataouinensis]|uniref:Uncharacterized protein n=1 Tax=Ramlibacter tataouinensis (strain ATCC BAA-407 / DSM 14655 / LMG 21543 / TTB310) TaxID=365046 RepID=F5XWQ4_RAMTT|nr:hypothetical protein [Ramlibacter tataouinensis]AEG94198.1 hypothetical protein Rta_30880 [Ramlibacter tataouinensis TTB310]
MTRSSDKLAQTRLAIVEHLQRKQENRRESQEQLQTKARKAVSPRRSPGRFSGFGDVGRNWWQHHPAHTVLELATPVLSRYAARKPAQFLGIAAVAGAAFVFARPWKLISLTGVLVALLRSSVVTNAISHAMSAAHLPQDTEEAEFTEHE